MAPNQLFRQQVIDEQINSLHGEVIVTPSLSYVVISGAMFLWFCLVLVWAFNANYARKEQVVGFLKPEGGTVRILGDGEGVIKQVLIKEGDLVIKDQPLFIVNGDKLLADGKSLEYLLLSEYQQQKQNLISQLMRMKKGYHAKLSNIEAQYVLAKENITIIQKQKLLLQEQIDITDRQLLDISNLVNKGHTSSATFDGVKEKQLELTGAFHSLTRKEIEQERITQTLKLEKSMFPNEQADQQNNITFRLNDLARQIATLRGQRAHIIKAPIAGVISNLQAKVGQDIQGRFSSATPLALISQQDDLLVAEIMLPVRAAGFIKIGQKINIRYDAFPYEKFGLYEGIITKISHTVLLPHELDVSLVSIQEPVYKVSAKIINAKVSAYGNKFNLKPGMTFSADIRLAQRSLLEWFFEPILTLRGKI